MTGRVERWLRESRLTSDDSIEARVEALLAAVRIGSQRNHVVAEEGNA